MLKRYFLNSSSHWALALAMPRLEVEQFKRVMRLSAAQLRINLS